MIPASHGGPILSTGRRTLDIMMRRPRIRSTTEEPHRVEPQRRSIHPTGPMNRSMASLHPASPGPAISGSATSWWPMRATQNKSFDAWCADVRRYLRLFHSLVDLLKARIACPPHRLVFDIQPGFFFNTTTTILRFCLISQWGKLGPFVYAYHVNCFQTRKIWHE